MTDPDRAFDLLHMANPAPTTVIADRPDARTFLAEVETIERRSVVEAAPVRRRGLVVAVAAFVVTLLVGSGCGLLSVPKTTSSSSRRLQRSRR